MIKRSVGSENSSGLAFVPVSVALTISNLLYRAQQRITKLFCLASKVSREITVDGRMSFHEMFNLGSIFKRYFEIIPALTDTLRDEVYRVRHQVYCEDLGFESIRPDKRETDEYDANSLHLLARSVKTGELVGCTRIVRPKAEDPRYRLPFEESCAAVLDRSIVDPAQLPRHRIAEVSRLAVVSGYRRRKGEENSAVGISGEDFGTPNQPRFPFVPIGLYLGTTELARLNGIDIVFVLTEERLANHFGRLGFDLQHIGKQIDHHGKRIPSMMNVTATINNMRTNLRSLYRVIAADIGRNYSSQVERPQAVNVCTTLGQFERQV